MRADELLEAGDMDGLATWKRILRAVDELLAKERPKGTAVPPQAKACPHCGLRLSAPPMTEVELKQTRGVALTVKIVAVLLILYMMGVVGYFIYDHLL